MTNNPYKASAVKSRISALVHAMMKDASIARATGNEHAAFVIATAAMAVILGHDFPDEFGKLAVLWQDDPDFETSDECGHDRFVEKERPRIMSLLADIEQLTVGSRSLEP